MSPTPANLLKRIFVLDPNSFYYFAFGSNLLAERLHLMNPSAEFVEVGLLKGYSLGFYGSSLYWMGAYATIYAGKSPNDKVFGAIWRLNKKDSESLDLQERQYRRMDVDVELQNDAKDVIKCRTYQIEEIDRFVPGKDLPSPHYMHVITSGAIEHGFPEEYVRYLKSIPDNGYAGPVKIQLKALEHLNKTN